MPAPAPAPAVSEPPPRPPARRAQPKLLAAIAIGAVLAGLAFTVFGAATNKIVDPVAQAATLSSSASGYRMRMSMEIATPGLAAPITVVGTGTFDVRDRAGSMSLAMNLGVNPQVVQMLGSSTLRMHEILDGATVYLSLPSVLMSNLGTLGKPWIKVDLTKIAGVPGLSSLESSPGSSDPSQMLRFLRAASNSIVAEGQQRAGGFETTHYRAALNLDQVPDALPSADRAVAQQALSALEREMQVHAIPVDVWVDAHHLVRRIQTTLDAKLPNAQTLHVGMTIDISNYGPQRRPTVPAPGDVQDIAGLTGAGG